MARLPTPGSDDNAWGDILNQYLLTEHASDGTHKTADILGTPGVTGKALVSDTGLSKGMGWKDLTPSDVGLSNVANQAQLPLAYLDTDGTLAGNSDTKVASQKAVKTYVDAHSGGGAPTDATFVTLSANTSLSAERVLTAGNLIDLADGGANSTVTVDVDLSEAGVVTPANDDTVAGSDTSNASANAKFTLEDVAAAWAEPVFRHARFMNFTDFVGIPQGSSDMDSMRVTNSGAGSNLVGIAPDAANRVGVGQLATGTATGRCAVHAGDTGLTTLVFGGGAWVFEADVKVSGALSDGTNTYIVRAGFLDSITGNIADGAYFEYDQSQSTAWRYVTASNSVRTAAASGTTVTIGAWVRLRIEVNAAGSSVQFFINGTSVGTVVATIPTGAGRETSFAVLIVQTVGTASRTLDADFLLASCDFTTAR